MCIVCSKYPVKGRGSLKRKIHKAAQYLNEEERMGFEIVNAILPREDNYSYFNERLSPPGVLEIDEWSFRVWMPQQIAVVLYHELLHFERYRDGRTQIEDEVMAESDRWAKDRGLRLPSELTPKQETLAGWLMQIR